MYASLSYYAKDNIKYLDALLMFKEIFYYLYQTRLYSVVELSVENLSCYKKLYKPWSP